MEKIAVVLFSIYVGCISNGLGQDIILTPSGFNASLQPDSNIIFQCRTEGTLVFLTVNGSSAGAVGVGVNPSPAMQDGDFITQNLTVPAREENDNLIIACFTPTTEAVTATFQVQGLLEPPPDFIIVELDVVRRQLSWSPPFTLDITDEDPDIIGYNICNNATGSCETVTETQFIFPNLQVPIEFSLSALNVVGESSNTTIVHDPCNSDQDPVSIDGSLVQTSTSFMEGNPIATFTFSLEIACFSLYVIETTVDSTDINSTLTHGPFIPAIDGEAGSAITLSVSVDSNLSTNDVHNASVIAVGATGRSPSTGIILFTTFDVQEVRVSEGPGTVSITCTFAEGSLANGCHAIIRAENISDIAMNISRVEQNGEEQSQTAVGEVAGLEIGVYEVSVFDLESDNTIDLQNPVQIVEVNVTDVQPTSPPTTSDTPSSPTTGPNMGEPGSDNNIPVIVGAVVAVVGTAILFLALGIVLLCVWMRRRRRAVDKREKKGSEAAQYEPMMRERTSAIFSNTDKPNDPPYALPTLTPELSRKHNSLQGSKRSKQSQGSTDSPAHSSHLPPGLPALPPLPPELNDPNVHYESLEESVKGSTEWLAGSLEKAKGPTNPIYAEPSSPTHPPPLPLSRPPGPPSFPNHLTIDSDAAASRQSTQSAYSLAPEVPPQNFSVEDIRELNLSLSEIALAGSQQSLSDSSSSLLPRVIPPPPPGFTTAADADARGSTSPVPPEVPVYDSPMSPPPHIPPRNYSEEDVAEGKPEVDDASRQLELEVEKLTALAEEIGESTSAF